MTYGGLAVIPRAICLGALLLVGACSTVGPGFKNQPRRLRHWHPVGRLPTRYAGIQQRWRPGAPRGSDLPSALTEPAPCDGCALRQLCATGLACERFWMFVHGDLWQDASMEPLKKHYTALFEMQRPPRGRKRRKKNQRRAQLSQRPAISHELRG
jgi:hypothetical protein